MELGNAIRILKNTMGEMEITGVNQDSNTPTEHFVKHKYMEEIIVPYMGVTDNVAFLTSSGDKYITFVDGVRCKVIDWKEVHICALEDDIQRLYHMDTWSFVRRWYKVYPRMSNMFFIYMRCEKTGGKNE